MGEESAYSGANMILRLNNEEPRASKRETKQETRKNRLFHWYHTLSPRFRHLISFVIFLFVSAIIWLITALSNEKNSHVTILFPLVYEDLSAEYAFETEPPQQVEVSLNVTGLPLLSYSMRHIRGSISLYVTEDDINKQRFRVPEALMRERVLAKLPGNANVLSITPASISIPFYRRSSKKVPVDQYLLIDEKSGYLVSATSIQPNVVTIYATKDKLSTISSVRTEKIALHDLDKTKKLKVALEPMEGVLYSHDSVELLVKVDELTQQEFELPITILNQPSDYAVRLLPSSTTLQVVLATDIYDRYTANDFRAVVDYNDIKDVAEGKSKDLLTIELQQIPEGITSFKLSPARVQYILEEKK